MCQAGRLHMKLAHASLASLPLVVLAGTGMPATPATCHMHQSSVQARRKGRGEIDAAQLFGFVRHLQVVFQVESVWTGNVQFLH